MGRDFCEISVDVVGLVDEWAARFFKELDYVNEGENETCFAEMMKKDLPQIRDYSKYEVALAFSWSTLPNKSVLWNVFATFSGQFRHYTCILRCLSLEQCCTKFVVEVFRIKECILPTLYTFPKLYWSSKIYLYNFKGVLSILNEAGLN
ncbi:uncharacterized protein LOC133830850 isoform X1 [Humulus lupulus]|uniref:uncharacterized protein LOC133830850 isoform X1 n=1 Tax=Humulus lupulus TaxID=3486 RepID=UPI002B40E09A|nr:uncharacterized protein LOC133830850 isoform X1 [Humulus lupulus]XP_062116912.1 uncharacterized protein LOC133830850 isoform X1 [Humulus lupulus]